MGEGGNHYEIFPIHLEKMSLVIFEIFQKPPFVSQHVHMFRYLSPKIDLLQSFGTPKQLKILFSVIK